MTTTFSNYTAAALADEIGELDGQIKALTGRLNEAKAELKARKLDVIQGERFCVKRVDATRWTMDSTSAKEALGEAWVTAHSKISSVTSFRIGVAVSAAA